MGGDSVVVDLRAEGDVVAESIGGGEADGLVSELRAAVGPGVAAEAERGGRGEGQALDGLRGLSPGVFSGIEVLAYCFMSNHFHSVPTIRVTLLGPKAA